MILYRNERALDECEVKLDAIVRIKRIRNVRQIPPLGLVSDLKITFELKKSCRYLVFGIQNAAIYWGYFIRCVRKHTAGKSFT